MIPTHELNDNTTLPAIGFGTSPMREEEAASAVRHALAAGYRLLDTAANYHNEQQVGQAIADSDVARDEIVLTTKLAGRDQGYESTLQACDASRRALGLDYIDLYLIHWPLPRIDSYVESWRAMIKLREQGVVRSIGVSNFTTEHLDRLQSETGVLPAVNQIELHPYFGQAEQRAANTERGVLTQAWSPLGRRSDALTNTELAAIAHLHGVTVAQVMLRWHIQLGVVPIPKSADVTRQQQNLDVFSFELSPEQMSTISGLERGRLGGDPDVHEEF